MSKTGVIKILSGLAGISLLICIFASAAFSYSDVYFVKPTSASNSGTANAVWETFRATCDSIDSVTFFVGVEATDTTASYNVVIYDSVPPYPQVWSGSRSARGWKHQDMGFGVHKPVTRGRTYYLQISISAQYQQTWNYFYDSNNPYIWGKMGTATFGLPPQNDLAAHIMGCGRGLDVWGMCTYQISSKMSASEMDTMLKCSRAEGTTFIREYFPWRYIQPDTYTFDWTLSDRLMEKAVANPKLTVLANLADGAEWCSTRPPGDTCIRDANNNRPDTMLYNHPPDSLYAPVFVNGTINQHNYFGYYVYKVVKRYGNYGDNNYGNPIQYWEIWNEENSVTAWDWPDSTKYPKVYPGGQRNVDSLISLYKRLVVVADSAIRTPGLGADTTAKFLMGGLERVQIDGKLWNACVGDSAPGHPYIGVWWLDKFLGLGGGQYIDVYAFHPYQEPHWLPGRVKVSFFQKDVDTLRQVLKAHGQGYKPLWANEVGWAASITSNISEYKQANNCVQFHAAAISQGANPNGPLDKLMWYELVNFWLYTDQGHSTNDGDWWGFCGTINLPGYLPKPMHYAFKQANTKLKDKYFNRRVALADTNVYAYEFEEPGTGKKTWVVWRASGTPDTVRIPARSAYIDTTKIAYDATQDSVFFLVGDASGFAKLVRDPDSIPVYVHEYTSPSRPDVIVDSLYTYPSYPKAGDYVFFYARLKNIGNATLATNVGNAVKFQMDGVTQKTYTDNREIMKDSTIIVGYNPYPPPGDGSIYDWKATWGDHLIRAWVNPEEKYVELRHDNNCGYLFRHIRPKVGLIINNNHKYSNHLANDTLSISMDGNTTPLPDSAKLLHEGSWTKIGVYGSRDTLVTFNGNGVKFDSVIVFQGGDRDTAGDSIIVDDSAPYTAITSPPDSQTVNLNAQVEFWGFSYDFEYHDSLWQIWENSFAWAEDSTRVGYLGMFWVPGYFGTWTAWSTGWHTHTLVSRDSATNIDTSVVHIYVNNSGGGDGDGFSSGFGSFGSSPVNVATDKKGNLIVAETQGSMVRKYSSKKDSLFAFSARRSDSTGLNWAVGMALKDSTILYVADGYNHCIKAFDKQGDLLLRFGSFGTDTSQFKQPCGIALDWKDRLWVTDRLNHRIQVFDTTGHFLFQFGSQGQDSGKFNSPTGIAINRYKQVFVSDTKNDRVQVFDSLGNWKKTIKQPDSLGFDTPTGICTDKHGNVFVADTKHNRIVELNPFGKRLFIFGKEGDSLCQFRNPIGVASSPGAHYLYVADMGNKRVSRFWVIRGDTLGGGGPQSKDAVRLPPKVTYLSQSYPNPTTGKALIAYGLAQESEVRLVIYNVAGQVVREYNQGKQKAWYYSITWDGRSNLGHRVGAGVYFYRLNAGSWVKTRKMIVIR